jgi:hypothetical protein
MSTRRLFTRSALTEVRITQAGNISQYHMFDELVDPKLDVNKYR